MGAAIGFATKADMDASLAHDAGALALVTNDPTPANNGTYRKTGASGSGSWVQSAVRVTGREGAVSSLTIRTNQLESDVVDARAYTDAAVAPLVLEVMTGEDIYWRALANPNQLFQAIWEEYNKSVWHLGDGVVVDSTGATLKLVEEELVFTIKLTEANQTFVYPTRNIIVPGQHATIDWGDGTTTEHNDRLISHAYTGAVGDEFQVRVRGNPVHFDFGAGNSARRVSAPMLKSIDKNTLPKTMEHFDLQYCSNLEYLSRGAFSSRTGTTFPSGWHVPIHNPNVVFHKDAFLGSSQITSIDDLFRQSQGDPARAHLPAGLFDPFVNVTSAVNAFRFYAQEIPAGLLDRMVNLEDVSSMFYGAQMTSIDNGLFANQTKLTSVANCFRLASAVVADAYQLYTDMNQGAPTSVSGCFNGASSMTNLALVPTAWKTL